VCVSGEGPLNCNLSSFIEMAPRRRHTAGPTETPTPPYTGRAGGTRKREKTRCAGSRDLLHHRAARSRDHIRAERGGDPPCHRSSDISVIGGEMRALGLLLPYAGERDINTLRIRTFLVRNHSRPSVAIMLIFLLIARFLLI